MSPILLTWFWRICTGILWLVLPPLITGIKPYCQTCWQLLHTSLHSLSTFFSFMTESKRYNPQSSCGFFPQLASDLLFLSVLSLLQIQCDRLISHTSTVILQLFIGSKPTLYLPLPPSSGSWSLLFLLSSPLTQSVLFFSSSLLSVEAAGLQSMPFHSASITFCSEEITFCLLFLPKICFMKWAPSSRVSVPGTLWFFQSIFLIVPTSDGSNLRARGLETTPFSPIQFRGSLS